MAERGMFGKVLLAGAAAAGAAAWAIAPRSFSDKRDNYVPSIPDVWYAHRGLHDAGSGLTAQYAAESGEYVALARRMAMKAGYGTPECVGPIAPENSLAAFAAACEAGYGIELDIQLTMDGQVVVAHDETLMRVAGDPRRICDLTYDELTRIPLYPTPSRPGCELAEPVPNAVEAPGLVVTPAKPPLGYYQHVPLFSDVLKVVAGRVPLIVEYKIDGSDWTPRCEELMEKGDALLQAYAGPYVVESFHPMAMRWYREHRPEVCPRPVDRAAAVGADRRDLLGRGSAAVQLAVPSGFRGVRLAQRRFPAGAPEPCAGRGAGLLDRAQPRRGGRMRCLVRPPHLRVVRPRRALRHARPVRTLTLL